MSTTTTVIGFMFLFVFFGWFCFLLFLLRDGTKNLYYEPAWQVRCPDCGFADEAAHYGIVKYRSKSWPKERKWIHCEHCRKAQKFFVETVPPINGVVPENQYYLRFGGPNGAEIVKKEGS